MGQVAREYSHNDTLIQHAARSVRKTWRTAAADAPVGLAEAKHNGRVSSAGAPRPHLRADAQEGEGVWTYAMPGPRPQGHREGIDQRTESEGTSDQYKAATAEN